MPSRRSRVDIFLSKVGLDDPAVGGDGAWRTLSDLLAERQHHDAVGERHHGAHVVLDEQHGHSARVDGADQPDHGVDLGRVEPGHDFIEQQQRRFRRERARQLEPLAIRERQPGCGLARPCAQADALHDGPRGIEGVPHGGMADQSRDPDIVDDGELREWPDDLEGARQPEPADLVGLEAVEAAAGEADLARVGSKEAREQVEDRGLPRPVGPDHPEHLALRHGQVENVYRPESAEALAEPRDLEEAHAGRFFASRRSAGYAPWGRNSTTPISRRPYTMRCTPLQPPCAKYVREISASGLRMNEPKMGPSTVPAPPTMGRMMISTDNGMPKTALGWSEKR